MKSTLIVAVVFLFAQFASSIEARKNPGEHWTDVSKDLPVPELIHNLVGLSKVPSVSNTKPSTDDCHTSIKSMHSKTFEPRPNVSAYSDDAKPNGGKFTKEFETRPNISAYNDKSKLQGENFVKDFEPRPSATSYGNNAKQEHETYSTDFEPRPNVTSYEE